jgi:hsp70-interacting protein
MSAGSNSKSGGGDPWAWLGLLKWTLAYQDGTKPSDETIKPMSKEDKEFLEKVMREGIIDENERMKFILEQFSKTMEYYKNYVAADEGRENADDVDDDEPPSTDAMEDLLQELRDIVEQVDYARAFVSLKGPTYLLGAITASSGIPESICNMCLLILATLSQNNPPVQKEMLELGAIKTLSEMFLQEECSLSTKTAIIQAISAIVRNYDLTEGVFEHLPQAPVLLVKGLDPDPVMTNETLRKKTLFFLRAFLTSDNSSSIRVNKFADAVAMVADGPYLADGSNAQIREISISLLNQLLELQFGIKLLLSRKELLVTLGVERISLLRKLMGDEAEMASSELVQWEAFLVALPRAKPEAEAIGKEDTKM